MLDVLDVADVPNPPRTRALSFYLVLFCLVIPIWSSLPLSWIYVIYHIYRGTLLSRSLFPRCLFFLALSEVCFSIYHFYLCQRISGPSPYGPADLSEIQTAFTRLLKAGLADLPEDGGDEESNRPSSPEENIVQLERDDYRAIDFRNSLRTWFGKVPWSSIRLLEVQRWLYWSIFNKDLPPSESLPASHKVVMDSALELLQKRAGCQIPSGSNPLIEPMRLTIDPVNVTWRPLTYYALIFLVNRGLRMWYETKWNAYQGCYDGLEYIVRIPKHWNPLSGPCPIVFIHGLGLGLLQYNFLIMHLLEAFGDRPVLIPLQPQISQDLFHPRFLRPMTRHQTAERLARLMHKFGWVHLNADGDVESSVDSEEEKDIADSLLCRRKKGITLMSHSNGSYTHAWMLKHYPKIIGRSLFIDPVTFCSWEGDVCYNFIYRTPMTGIELVMRYFVGTELGVANLLQRHFDWVSNSLWYEEIPNARDPSKTVFILGGRDSIINAERVRRYLTSHGVRKGLWYDANGRHGQALVRGSTGHADILRWLQNDS